MSRYTGYRTRGAWARGLAARRTSRASWPVSGSHFLRSLPPTSRPALRQSPSARDTTAVDPRSPAHSRSRPARSPKLTCLAPPPQASSAPPRPGTEDSPQPQPIARRAGIGGGSDANVRQSQARLLKLQTNGKATAPPRPARGGERAGRVASVGGAGAPGQEGPRLGRGDGFLDSFRIRLLRGGGPVEFRAGIQWTQKTGLLLKMRWTLGHLFSSS